MLVTIGLLVLVVSFELPFWVVVIGWLGGPNSKWITNASKSQPTLSYIWLYGKKLVSRFGTYHCSVKGGQAYWTGVKIIG